MTAKAEAIGIFVPWTPGRKDTPGWITDANGCDIWHGSNAEGYGRVRIDGRDYLVTRVRFEREIGPIPEGMDLDHFVCDNGAGGCCNPFHCRPVTNRENVLRGNGVTSAHAAKTHCLRGHLLSGANLDKYRLARGARKCRICSNARQRLRERRRLSRVAA